MNIRTYVYSSVNNTINTLNHNTLYLAPIPFHSQHLQLRKVYRITRISTLSLLILNTLFSLIPLSASPKDSPLQANNPRTISVRLGRSIHHFSMRYLLEIDTVFTSWKHSAPTSIRSRTVRSMPLFILLSLTLNPQFVAPIEAGSVFLLLPHLQCLQRITIYKSQEGEAHTSHYELHELNTTPASNTQRMQRFTATHSELTLLPAHRALPNRDGLDVGMVLTLEYTHVGEGEGRAVEGGEAREGREIEFSAALHSGVHIDLFHRVRETVLIRGVGEVIGGGENELLQCGGV